MDVAIEVAVYLPSIIVIFWNQVHVLIKPLRSLVKSTHVDNYSVSVNTARSISGGLCAVLIVSKYGGPWGGKQISSDPTPPSLQKQLGTCIVKSSIYNPQ